MVKIDVKFLNKMVKIDAKFLNKMVKIDVFLYAYMLIHGNIGVSDTKITLPLYMAYLSNYFY